MADVRFDTAYGFEPEIGGYGGTDTRVDRTTVERLDDIVNVKDWGATGNGSTDDTGAINDAIDHAWELGGVGNEFGAIVYFPSGSYLIGSPPLYLDRGTVDGKTHKSYIQFIGAGRDATSLVGSYSTGVQIDELTAGFLVKCGGAIFSGASVGGQVLCLQDLSIINNSTAQNSGALQVMSSGNNFHMVRCGFHGYIGVSHSSNVFAASLRDCVFTCSVPYTAANTATRRPLYDPSNLFLDHLTDTVSTVTKAGSTATVTTSSAHGLPSGTSRVALMWFTPNGWTPDSDGSEIVTATNTGASTFTYTLTNSPSAFSPGGDGLTPFFTQSRAIGSVGYYGIGTVIINCSFEGFDAGAALAENSNTIWGCKFYRCGVGLLVGIRGGSPIGISEGAKVRPTSTFYRGCGGWTISTNWFDRCEIGIHYRSNGTCVAAANRISGLQGPWDAVSISNITTNGTTATVTSNSHNLPTGDTWLYLVVSPPAWTPNGLGNQAVQVTKTSANAFTYALAGSPATFVSGTWNYVPDYGVASTSSSSTTHFCYAIDTPTNIAGFSCDYTGLAAVFENQNNVVYCTTGTTWVQPAASALATCSWRFIQCGNATSYPGVWSVFGHCPGLSDQKGPFQGQTFQFIDCSTQGTFGGTVTDGGANHYKVRYDGTNWTRVG